MTRSFPLHIPSSPAVGTAAFATDKLERAPLAKALSGYVSRLKFGAVLAVDAEWGQGKTWFAKNWKKSLEDDGHSAIYIDAFESDYMEDPFLLITGVMLATIKNEGVKKRLIDSAKNVALTIAPTALKAAIRGGGHLLLGVSNLDEKMIETAEKLSGKAEDALGKILEDKIKNFRSNQRTLSVFRNNLRDFAKAREKPLVIIIDELDRCKPEFAVKLLERIKHFFDVENVVFVLFMHKQQMHNAIQGVYGQSTDANTYLGKFLNFTFTLDQPREGELRPFIEAELVKYDIPVDNQIHEFIGGILSLSEAFRFTPRQVEMAIALLSLAYPIRTAAILLAELVVLKISRPDLLDGLLRNDSVILSEILEILAGQEKRNNERKIHNEELLFLIIVHSALLAPEDDPRVIRLQNDYGLRVQKIKNDYAQVIKLLNLMVR